MTSRWPELSSSWEDTRATVHMWTQIVGKVRLALEPPVNHWWQVTLYVSARGLTTSLMHATDRGVEMEFDFVAHQLAIRTTTGDSRNVALEPRSVADFYDATMTALRDLGVRVSILARPVEIAEAIPFPEDTVHSAYDADRDAPVLARARRDRPGHEGIPRPVHRQGEPGPFLLGRLRPGDHPLLGPARAAASRAAFRTAPTGSCRRRTATRSAAAGSGPAGAGKARSTRTPIPNPMVSRRGADLPAAAYYDAALGEFLLPYSEVRTAADPDALLLEFLQSTYEAAAEHGDWDRAALERGSGARGVLTKKR